MSCVFNDPECNAKGEAGVPHPSKPGAIVYGLCTCPGVSYRYGVCTGIPEAYLPSFEEFYRNMTGESLTLDLSQPVITRDQPLDVLTPEELMEVAMSQVTPVTPPLEEEGWAFQHSISSEAFDFARTDDPWPNPTIADTLAEDICNENLLITAKEWSSKFSLLEPFVLDESFKELIADQLRDIAETKTLFRLSVDSISEALQALLNIPPMYDKDGVEVHENFMSDVNSIFLTFVDAVTEMQQELLQEMKERDIK